MNEQEINKKKKEEDDKSNLLLLEEGDNVKTCVDNIVSFLLECGCNSSDDIDSDS